MRRVAREVADASSVGEGASSSAGDSSSVGDASPVEGAQQRRDRDPSSVESQQVRDHARSDAVAELAGLLPGVPLLPPAGREHLDAAFADARRRRPELAATFDVLAPVLGDPAQPAALRFQQTSGAVMAKGVEDCAFYRTSRLTSLTEVGGDPSEFSLSVEEFHAAMAERQRERPLAMTTTSTHDTKRGEDVRARITVLAELPEVWAETLDRLLALAPLPDPGFGNLLWQAVVGAWPASRERLHAYAEKAMREAGDRTTWTDAGRDVREGRPCRRRRGVRRSTRCAPCSATWWHASPGPGGATRSPPSWWP